MIAYTFSQDNTEGYTDAELATLNQELEAFVDEQREDCEARGGTYTDYREVQDRQHFADIVASR